MALTAFVVLVMQPTWILLWAFLASLAASCLMGFTADTWAERDFEDYEEVDKRLDKAEKTLRDSEFEALETKRLASRTADEVRTAFKRLDTALIATAKATEGAAEVLAIANRADANAKEALEKAANASLASGFRPPSK